MLLTPKISTEDLQTQTIPFCSHGFLNRATTTVPPLSSYVSYSVICFSDWAEISFNFWFLLEFKENCFDIDKVTKNSTKNCWVKFQVNLTIETTEKPRFNESQGTKVFVPYCKGFVIAGGFTLNLTTKGFKIDFFIAGIARILLLKG